MPQSALQSATGAQNAGHPLLPGVLVLMAFSLGFAEFVLIGIVGDVAADIGADLTAVGNLVGYYALACAVGTPLIALATGGMGRTRLIAALLVLFNLGNLATLFVSAYEPLVASRLLPAATGGTLMALCMTLVPEAAPRRTALVLSLVLAGYSVSSVVGVPIGTVLAAALGWRAAYVLVFVCGLVSSVALMFCLPPDPVRHAQAASGVRAQLRLLGDARVLLNVAMMMCVAGSTYVFYTYLTPILQDVMGYSTAVTGVILGLFGVACVVSNILSGKVASGPGLAGLPVIFLVHAVLLAALALTIPLGAVGVANMLLVGLVMYAMNSTVQLFYQQVARRDYPQALTFSASLHPMAFNAGIAGGSLLGGAVVGGAGAAGAPVAGMLATGPVGAVLALAGAVLAVALNRAVAGRKAAARPSGGAPLQERGYDVWNS